MRADWQRRPRQHAVTPQPLLQPRRWAPARVRRLQGTWRLALRPCDPSAQLEGRQLPLPKEVDGHPGRSGRPQAAEAAEGPRRAGRWGPRAAPPRQLAGQTVWRWLASAAGVARGAGAARPAAAGGAAAASPAAAAAGWWGPCASGAAAAAPGPPAAAAAAPSGRAAAASAPAAGAPPPAARSPSPALSPSSAADAAAAAADWRAPGMLPASAGPEMAPAVRRAAAPSPAPPPRAAPGAGSRPAVPPLPAALGDRRVVLRTRPPARQPHGAGSGDCSGAAGWIAPPSTAGNTCQAAPPSQQRKTTAQIMEELQNEACDTTDRIVTAETSRARLSQVQVAGMDSADVAEQGHNLTSPC